MQARHFVIFLLVTLVTPVVAVAIEPDVLSPQAVLGGIYVTDTPQLHHCMKLLPPEASEVFFFVIQNEDLLYPYRTYRGRRSSAIEFLGRKGGEEDFERLREQMLLDYRVNRPRKVRPEPYGDSPDYSSVYAYARAFGFFTQRRVAGWNAYIRDLDRDDYWTKLEFPGFKGKSFPFRDELLLRAHQIGETGEIESRLKPYLATIMDEEVREEHAHRYRAPAQGEIGREWFESIEQLDYSLELNEHFEKVYRELPKEVREAFEKRMAKLKDRK